MNIEFWAVIPIYFKQSAWLFCVELWESFNNHFVYLNMAIDKCLRMVEKKKRKKIQVHHLSSVILFVWSLTHPLTRVNTMYYLEKQSMKPEQCLCMLTLFQVLRTICLGNSKIVLLRAILGIFSKYNKLPFFSGNSGCPLFCPRLWSWKLIYQQYISRE